MRMFFEGEWFEPMRAEGVYEFVFESVVRQSAADLFPGYLTYRFDPILSAPQLGNVQPDLILIDREFRHWYIVEVETAAHSWSGHVRPQLEKIVAAKITDKHVSWLGARESSLDVARLSHLMLGVPHRTMLLVNAPVPKWEDGLQQMPAVSTAIVEMFRSRQNRTVLRVNGQQPEKLGDFLCSLSRGDDWFSDALEMSAPSVLPSELSRIDVEYDNRVDSWHVKFFGANRMLFPPSAVSLQGNEFVLEIVDDRYRIGVPS